MSSLDQQLVADCFLQRFLATSAAYLALPLAGACSSDSPTLSSARIQRGDCGCEVSDVCLPGA